MNLLLVRFLALDPGSRKVGWCVFDNEKITNFGEIDYSSVDYGFRFGHISAELSQLHKDYRFDEVVSEHTVQSPGKKIPELEIACITIRKWAEKNRSPFHEYYPATWKASAMGDSEITKEETARLVLLQYPQLKGVSERVFSAAGIGIHHYGIRKIKETANG